LASAQSASNVNATYRSFNSPTKEGIGNKWDLNTSGVFCAAQDGNKSLSWRSKHDWAAFCGVWRRKRACGMCLNVCIITFAVLFFIFFMSHNFVGISHITR